MCDGWCWRGGGGLNIVLELCLCWCRACSIVNTFSVGHIDVMEHDDNNYGDDCVCDIPSDVLLRWTVQNWPSDGNSSNNFTHQIVTPFQISTTSPQSHHHHRSVSDNKTSSPSLWAYSLSTTTNDMHQSQNYRFLAENSSHTKWTTNSVTPHHCKGQSFSTSCKSKNFQLNFFTTDFTLSESCSLHPNASTYSSWEVHNFYSRLLLLRAKLFGYSYAWESIHVVVDCICAVGVHIYFTYQWKTLGFSPCAVGMCIRNNYIVSWSLCSSRL